jgi:hypothetical protein
VNVIAKYRLRNGFTMHYLADGLTILTGKPLEDGSFVAVAGRPAGTQACEGKTADAAFERALACVREWRGV